MSIRETIFEHLEGIAQGTFSEAHAYPVGDKDPSSPGRFIVYEMGSQDPQRHMGGGAALTQGRFNIYCLAGSAMDSHKLSEAVRESLDNKRGPIGGNNVLSVAAFVRDETDSFIAPADASHRGRHMVTVDVSIWYPETVTPTV